MTNPAKLPQVSVPLPGFSGLRLASVPLLCLQKGFVSVPLPGFSGLKPGDKRGLGAQKGQLFQSRCRDSVG